MLAERTWTEIVLIVLLVLAGWVALRVFLHLLKYYVQARTSGASISFLDLLGMRLRKTDLRVIVLSSIRAAQAGLEVSTRDMESHYLAGGRVPQVVTAMGIAKREGVGCDWRVLTALDLAGRDVLAITKWAAAQPDRELLTDWDRLVGGLPEELSRPPAV